MENNLPDNYYHVLGVAPSASDAEIRNRFKHLARQYHPDKRTVAIPTDPSSSSNSSPPDEMFSVITRAYEILGDPTKRAAYNVSMGIGNLESVQELQRRDAERAKELMAVTFDQRRKTELSCGGLVVDDAWYGASEAVLQPEKHASQVINVTRQLQCLVDDSKLVIAKGDAKSHLTGVWDPCPGNAEKALKVNYFFKGKLHQTMVRDDEMLLAPVKAHLITQKSSKRLDKPNPPKPSQASKKQSEAWAMHAVALLGLGVVLAARLSRGVVV